MHPEGLFTHRPLRVLFISARSGGGHEGTADALEHYLREALDGAVIFQRLDVYGPALRVLPWLARIRQYTYRFWQLFFALTEHRWVFPLLQLALVGRLTRSVHARIQAPPDLLVATHFAGAQVLEPLASKLPGPPATLIVATDYQPHRAWFGTADLLVVSETPGLGRARRLCRPSQKVIGIPLLPCLPPSTRTEPSGASNRLRLIAIMGAEGTGGHQVIRLIESLQQRPWSHRIDLEVVCGRNETLKRALRRLQACAGDSTTASRHGRMTLKISGFVNDLRDRLAQADICLLRASPLVMTEVIASGVPSIAFDWHAHEAANAELLTRWECGRAVSSVRELMHVLQDWVTHPDQLAHMREATKRRAGNAFCLQTMKRILDILKTGRGSV